MLKNYILFVIKRRFKQMNKKNNNTVNGGFIDPKMHRNSTNNTRIVSCYSCHAKVEFSYLSYHKKELCSATKFECPLLVHGFCKVTTCRRIYRRHEIMTHVANVATPLILSGAMICITKVSMDALLEQADAYQQICYDQEHAEYLNNKQFIDRNCLPRDQDDDSSAVSSLTEWTGQWTRSNHPRRSSQSVASFIFPASPQYHKEDSNHNKSVGRHSNRYHSRTSQDEVGVRYAQGRQGDWDESDDESYSGRLYAENRYKIHIISH